MPPRRRRTPTVSADVHDLFFAKLASSGLTLEHAAALDLTPLEGSDVARLGAWAGHRPALRIGYHGLDGQPLSDVPRGEPFFRLRYLESAATFAAQIDPKKGDKRYTQPPDTLPCVYLPRTEAWAELAADPTQALLITEGELKAAAACVAGFPCVGLGGVWNFRSAKHGVLLNPVLASFEWLRRNVYLVFDSDLATNPNVAAALTALADELGQRGAFVHVAWLPSVLGAGEKVGLDDFLLFHGEDGPPELGQVLGQADLLGLVQPLLDLNKRYVYVANPGLLVNQATLTKYKPGALAEHLGAPTTVLVKKLAGEGGVRYEKASAGAVWLKWPLRTEVDRITYAPGRDRFLRNGTAQFNTWPGWGCEAKKGDVKPFLALVDHLFHGAEPWARQWFLRWLAYPVRYPGTKLFTSVLFHGRLHGTGKSLIGYTMKRVYGANFTEIKQKHLHGDFNEWAENKQFVMGDDITGSDKREDNDVLKSMVTQEELRINAKFVPTYTIPDCINYYFTANQIDAFFLEDDDRRNFIHEVKVGPLTEEFYMDYAMWLDGEGGPAVFQYLQDLDLGDFNPAARAPLTTAKERMIADGQSDLGSWVRQLLIDPDPILKVGHVAVARDLFTNAELLQLYDPLGKTKVTANGLGRELRRAGAEPLNEGRAIRVGGALARFYAVRNAATWSGALPAAIAAHVEGLTKAAAKPPKY